MCIPEPSVVQVQAQAPAANDPAQAHVLYAAVVHALPAQAPRGRGRGSGPKGSSTVPKPHWCAEAAVAGPSKAAPAASASSSASRWNSQRSGPSALCRRRPCAAGPSARRQRSGPSTLVQAQVAVNYAMYPKVAGRPKVLSKFSILTGLVRLISAHPIIAVPLKGSSRSHSQVNLIAFISQAKYVAVPSGSGSPFLLFWGG